MQRTLIAVAVMFATVSFVTVAYVAAGHRQNYVPNAAAGTLTFEPGCEPMARQVLQVKDPRVGITFEQYRRAQVWLDMCSACEKDHGPQCWTLFQRVHPEVLVKK